MNTLKPIVSASVSDVLCMEGYTRSVGAHQTTFTRGEQEVVFSRSLRDSVQLSYTDKRVVLFSAQWLHGDDDVKILGTLLSQGVFTTEATKEVTRETEQRLGVSTPGLFKKIFCGHGVGA